LERIMIFKIGQVPDLLWFLALSPKTVWWTFV